MTDSVHVPLNPLVDLLSGRDELIVIGHETCETEGGVDARVAPESDQSREGSKQGHILLTGQEHRSAGIEERGRLVHVVVP